VSTGSDKKNDQSAQISQDLETLGSSSVSLHSPEKQAAVYRLRQNLVQSRSVPEKLAACAKIEQERYALWPTPPSPKSSAPTTFDNDHRAMVADRVRGLIYGCALGDAVGLATEFLSRRQVQDFYGNNTLLCPQPARVYPDTHRIMWQAGDWTDDTDQMIVVLKSLFHCVGTFPQENSISNEDLSMLERDFATRLLDWKEHGFADLGDEGGVGMGQQTKRVLTSLGFVEHPTHVAQQVWQQGKCRAAANGALMRTAVTGLPFYWDLSKVNQITASICQTTHADPKCVASCVSMATLVALLLQRKDEEIGLETENDAQTIEALIQESLDVASRYLPDEESAQAEFKDYVQVQSQTLEALELDDPSSIGYTYKCLGAGIWGLRATTGTTTDPSCMTFDEMIQTLVSQGGDADTNAMVAGGLWGCRRGFRQLPSEWIAQLPHAAWLEAHVQKVLFLLDLLPPVRENTNESKVS